MGVGAVSPVAEHAPTEEHATEVGEMRDIVVRTEGRPQFDGSEDENKVFGLHGNGREEEHDAIVGIEHAEGEQYAIDGSRCANGGGERTAKEEEVGRLPQLLTQGGTKTTHEVEGQKPLCAEGWFHASSKHPQCQHVEHQVGETTMKEHVGDGLIDVEIGREYVVETPIEVETGKNVLCHEDKHVDEQELSCDFRNGIEHIGKAPFRLSLLRGSVGGGCGDLDNL